MNRLRPLFRSPWLWLAILVLASIWLISWLNQRFPHALASRDGQISLTHSLLILAFVGASVVFHRRIGAHRVIKYTLAWLGVAGVLFVAYSFREDAKNIGNRLLAELIPAYGEQNGDAVRFAVSPNGHFIIEGQVEGATVRFMLDTGASDVVLSPDDARRLGFDPARLDYTKTYNTANGKVRGAPVTLPYLQVGPIRIENVRASVNQAAMGQSLLGMSFLGRLSGYEATAHSITLHP